MEPHTPDIRGRRETDRARSPDPRRRCRSVGEIIGKVPKARAVAGEYVTASLTELFQIL